MIGRIFYGISIAALGVLTMVYRDVPYMLLPPNHAWIKEHLIAVYAIGALLLPAGAGITLGRKVGAISLLLGTALLLIFFFWFVPYELTVSKSYTHFGDWENKESIILQIKHLDIFFQSLAIKLASFASNVYL